MVIEWRRLWTESAAPLRLAPIPILWGKRRRQVGRTITPRWGVLCRKTKARIPAQVQLGYVWEYDDEWMECILTTRDLRSRGRRGQQRQRRWAKMMPRQTLPRIPQDALLWARRTVRRQAANCRTTKSNSLRRFRRLGRRRRRRHSAPPTRRARRRLRGGSIRQGSRIRQVWQRRLLRNACYNCYRGCWGSLLLLGGRAQATQRNRHVR